MQLSNSILQVIAKFLNDKSGVETDFGLSLAPTRKEFEGDVTLVVFPVAGKLKTSPENIANEIGNFLISEHTSLVTAFNVIKGFLNLTFNEGALISQGLSTQTQLKLENPKTIVVEFSSPNTNKPLHLGHIRNILLGWSVSEILKANGHNVHRVQVVNDRGIHICKSMIAWLKFGNNENPDSSGLKGDKLVGKYYVAYDKAYKAEVEKLVESGVEKEVAEKTAPIFNEAQQMLRDWEDKKPETIALWQKMNAWVYAGFETTYKSLSVSFDKNYYESNTYLLGKKIVEEGLSKDIFYKKEDGSVWIDLTEDGLDHKILLRSDGTSVYITQDIGTAIERFHDFAMDGMIYTVGNEQDYHFRVLFLILKKLGYAWADACYHLSYGMVDLPSGKMKSREGTVVDADDLMAEVIESAKAKTLELREMENPESTDAVELFNKIGLGALKYYILKVDPKKRMIFNPEESIDLHGNTGPFIQYTYARIKALIRRADAENIEWKNAIDNKPSLHPLEHELLFNISRFTDVLEEAGNAYSPALLANYTFELAQLFNKFYHELSIFNAPNERDFRLVIANKTAEIISTALHLLGIKCPEAM